MHAPIPYSLSLSKSFPSSCLSLMFLSVYWDIYWISLLFTVLLLSSDAAEPSFIQEGATEPRIGLIAVRAIGPSTSPLRIQAWIPFPLNPNLAAEPLRFQHVAVCQNLPPTTFRNVLITIFLIDLMWSSHPNTVGSKWHILIHSVYCIFCC